MPRAISTIGSAHAWPVWCKVVLAAQAVEVRPRPPGWHRADPGEWMAWRSCSSLASAQRSFYRLWKRYARSAAELVDGGHIDKNEGLGRFGYIVTVRSDEHTWSATVAPACAICMPGKPAYQVDETGGIRILPEVR
jgi:hypothetical protein